MRHLGLWLGREIPDEFVQVILLGVVHLLFLLGEEEFCSQIKVPETLIRERQYLREKRFFGEIPDGQRQRAPKGISLLRSGQGNGFVQSRKHLLYHFQIIRFDADCGELETVELDFQIRVRLTKFLVFHPRSVDVIVREEFELTSESDLAV